MKNFAIANVAGSNIDHLNIDTAEASMRTVITAFVSSIIAFSSALTHANECPAPLQQTLKRLHSSDTVDLCKLANGKPLLVVNTASHCGYTSQFKGLEQLHEAYKDRGLVVIGFPSDDFHQEAGEQAETAKVCYLNFGVKFTMLAPGPVTGPNANPLFKSLAEQSAAPSWNFSKYVVGRDGKLVAHFDSGVTPESSELRAAIEKALQ